jgi:hypothetical protein
VPSSEDPSALSTASVLQALTVLGGLGPRVTPLIGRMFDEAIRDDSRIIGWRASSAAAPRLETTAAVLDTFQRVGAELDIDDALRMLRDLLDDTACTRPISLTLALDAVLRLAPESSLTVDLADALLALRVDFGGALLWPEKLVGRYQPMLEPSVAHTARAVNALRYAPVESARDAVAVAEAWLADSKDLSGVSELVSRDLGGGRREELAIHSFTSAHVVRALASSPTPSRWRINRALDYVWERFDPELHLWAWGNGDVPAWMLMDAVSALHDAALAMAFGPGQPERPRW